MRRVKKYTKKCPYTLLSEDIVVYLSIGFFKHAIGDFISSSQQVQWMFKLQKVGLASCQQSKMWERLREGGIHPLRFK